MLCGCGEKEGVGMSDRGYESFRYIPFCTMESAAALTVVDLRSRAVTNWVQNVTLHVPFRRGSPMEVHLNAQTVLPVVLLFRSMQHRASSARATSGSAQQTFPLSTTSGSSSSHSDNASDADASDACEYGFRYASDYGSSETDDCTSDDQF
jgi:hypothetical protein